MKTSVHDNLYFYWVSLDGTEGVHDQIRGEGSYSKKQKEMSMTIFQALAAIVNLLAKIYG
jgi:hypothetical protein